MKTRFTNRFRLENTVEIQFEFKFFLYNVECNILIFGI